MKNIQKIFRENLLLKVTSINGVGTIIGIITGIITQKALAIFVGPQGLGVIGNFRDFIEAIKTISTLGIANGVVKYVSEFKKDVTKLTETLSTALFILIVPAIVLSLVLFFSATYWNEQLFSEAYDFTLLFKVAALALPLYALNLLVVSVINGYAKYKIYISINIVSNILTLGLLLFLLWKFRLEGALYGILLAPVLSFLITLGFIFKKRYKIEFFKISAVSKQQLLKFMPFMIMALISSISLPVVRIAIRDYIEVVDGDVAVGYWEGMYRISNFYLMFISSLMTLYILPKLSEITTDREFRREIKNYFKTVVPLFTLGIIILYLFRDLVISILLTGNFAPMEQLFAWQLSGDFFKVAAMAIAYQFWAKRMFWHYVFSELFSVALIYLLSMFFIEHYGFVGASMAYTLSSFIYLLLILTIFKRKLFYKIPKE